MEQQSNTQEDEAPPSNNSGWLFAVARPCQISALLPRLLRKRTGPRPVRSGPGIPRSIPYPEFGLRSRPVRSGPGPMHTPKCNSSIRPTSSRNIAYECATQHSFPS